VSELVTLDASREIDFHGVENSVPEIVARAGPRTFERYLEFFAAHIRNPNTRAAYSTAAVKFFDWCQRHGIIELDNIRRLHVAAYIEELTLAQAAPTVKQNLAALRMLFDYLGVPRDNPVEGVRGPKHVVRMGRTPVLSAEQARMLLDSIDTGTIAGLRDAALISLMVYTFARVSAAVGVQIQDVHFHGARRWVRLYEKGSREHSVPLHHRAEEAIEAYVVAAGLAGQKGPLFRTIDPHGRLSGAGMTRFTAWEMVKRRAKAAGIVGDVTNHTFRATGITVYLENGGTIENARNIAAHASIKTTQTYDRRSETITLDEISRIRL
jgi:site-specific recombinase XerD